MEEYSNDQIQETVAASEPSVDQEAQQDLPANKPADDKQQENFRNLRIAKERAEHRERELENRIKELEKAKEPQFDDEDYVPRRYVDEKMNAQKKELQQLSMEYKLRSNYPDFDKVVNDATIAALRERNPAMAMALSQVSDDYSKASGAYEAIKSLGLYEEDKYSADREKAERNANSPRPTQSISPQRSKSPLDHANAFADGSPEHMNALYREMMAARKAH